MTKVKNTSTEAQHFPHIGTFEPNKEVEVTEEQAAYLERSPFMERVTKTETKKATGTQRDSSFKGVDRD